MREDKRNCDRARKQEIARQGKNASPWSRVPHVTNKKNLKRHNAKQF